MAQSEAMGGEHASGPEPTVDPLARRPGSGRLAGRVAVVVGGGQADPVDPADMTIGNGRATSIVFAREGAKVLVVDRDLDRAQATVALIQAAGGVASAHAADITDEDSAASITDAALTAFDGLDILHNNVGIGGEDGGVTSLARSAWDRIFATNVTGTFLTCKYAVPVMRERGGGAIINVSSVAADAAAGLAAYKSSKAALNALTHHLATANFNHAIRVNGIMPGLMDTPMAIGGYVARGHELEELRQRRHRQVPLGRQMGTGWDTAYAALFLASDEARFITGVILPVDGGALARIG